MDGPGTIPELSCAAPMTVLQSTQPDAGDDDDGNYRVQVCQKLDHLLFIGVRVFSSGGAVPSLAMRR